MQFIKPFLILLLIFAISYILNIYLKYDFFILYTLLCISFIIYKMSRLNNIQNKTFRLTQISIFSSIATISRCFIKIAPHSSAFLPIITLASFVTDKDCGFLLGAFSIFMSNIFLGQGSWTPWQMVAAGILGYLSGAVFNSKKVKPSVTKLTVFYVFCLTFIYCPIMNLYSFLLIAKNVNINGIITYFTSCFIIDMFNSLYSAPFIYILYTPIIKTIRNTNKFFKR